jgi:hypothetical protein
VVLVSSRLGLSAAALQDAWAAKGLHAREHPFFRRYGVKLPSSLTEVRSSTWVCSTSLPVSVCGTGTRCSPNCGVSCQFRPNPIGHCLRADLSLASRCRSTYQLGRRSSRRGVSPPGTSGSNRTTGGTGISTCYPSASPFGLSLGPTTSPRISRAVKPSDFRWWRFARHFCVTHPDIRTRPRSTVVACATASLHGRRSPTTLMYLSVS